MHATGVHLRWGRIPALFVLGVLVLSFFPVMGQDKKTDLTALMHETQKTLNQEHTLSLIWWIPEEFWQISFEKSPGMAANQKERALEVLRPYILVGVVNGDIGPFGAVTYEDEKTTRERFKLVDRDGAVYQPLPETDVSPDLQNFLAGMKPMLANMLGPMGKNFNFFVFPAKSKKGQAIANARQEGSFSVRLGETRINWRLPLGSLLPERVCSRCSERLSGAFKFCPYDGTDLGK